MATLARNAVGRNAAPSPPPLAGAEDDAASADVRRDASMSAARSGDAADDRELRRLYAAAAQHDRVHHHDA